MLGHEEHRRRNDDRRNRLPDRRCQPANQQGRSAGVLRVDGQPRLPVGHRRGPIGCDQRSRARLESLEHEGIGLAARRDVDFLDQSRIGRCRVPAIVSIRKPCGRILIRAWHVGLKEQIRSRQLAIEILCKLRRAKAESRAQTITRRFADPPQPDVLQRGEQQDEGQQCHREDHQRRPETHPHAASLARDPTALLCAHIRFYVLNNLFARA